MRNSPHEQDNGLPGLMAYPGSKASIGRELERRKPPESRECQVDLFTGGGGFFYGTRAGRINILNDIDNDVIVLHSAIAGQPDAVMVQLSTLRPSRLKFNQLKKLRDSASWVVLPEVERAAYVLYLVKCSAAGKMESFCASARGGSNFNPAIDLHPYSQKLDRVIFENVDWRMLAERVALKPNEASLFIYADPPYTVAEARSHYRHNFRFEDHLMLARVLTRISQRNDGGRRNVKIMVSYDEDPLIRSLYRPQLGWRIDEISVGYRIAQDKKAMRHELVITNYDVPNSEVQGKS